MPPPVFLLGYRLLRSLQSSLNDFMGAGKTVWRAVRSRLIELLSADNAELRDNAALRASALFDQSAVRATVCVMLCGLARRL